jgi:predicted dehydrogenase
LFDLHIHDLDQILWLFGKPSAVAASMSTDRRRGSILYQYPDLVVTSEFNANLMGGLPFKMTYRAHFERATLFFDGSEAKTLSLWKDGRESHPKVKSDDAYEGEIRHMVQCICQRHAPHKITADEARESVRLAVLIRKAVQTKRWIPV